MYTPASFAESDRSTLHDAIERYSFATLISSANGEPRASHLPLLLDRDHGDCGRLVGHMARANSQWQDADGQRVLAIFHGPHSYISPSWYEAESVVPTWNYVAVHASGVFHLDDDRARRREIVERYVETYESSREQPWQLASAPGEFVDSLLDAIVGFVIDIDRLEGKWKMNQNQDEQRQARVANALAESAGDDDQEIANMMQAILERKARDS